MEKRKARDDVITAFISFSKLNFGIDLTLPQIVCDCISN